MRKTLLERQEKMRVRMYQRKRVGWIPGSSKLWPAQREQIVDLAISGSFTQEQIAGIFKVSQPLVHEVLKREGLTRENKPAETRVCAQCGEPVRINGHRRRARNSFCCEAHYFLFLNNPAYQRSVWGTKLARRKVTEHFQLQEGNIVHHQDGNDNNNELTNLWVFATSGEHTSYHRGGGAQPIWRGGRQA